MLTQKLYDITIENEVTKQHKILTSAKKEPVMLKRILECPNCTSILRAWYQSTVTKITCPKCWAEIPVIDLSANRF